MYFVFRFGLLLYRQLMVIQVLVDLSVREPRIFFISVGILKIDDLE